MKYLVRSQSGVHDYDVVEANGFIPENLICQVPEYFSTSDGKFVELKEINGKMAPILNLEKKKSYEGGVAYIEMKAKLPWYKRIFA